jgi:hypothetical protein
MSTFTSSGDKPGVVIDEPWKRAYVMFEAAVETHFLPDEKASTA